MLEIMRETYRFDQVNVQIKINFEFCYDKWIDYLYNDEILSYERLSNRDEIIDIDQWVYRNDCLNDWQKQQKHRLDWYNFPKDG